ncbi:hypothetical protein ALQ81_00233, partial [Pseudomonas syringae pv. pisi]
QTPAAIDGEGEACMEPWAYARQWIVQALSLQSPLSAPDRSPAGGWQT